MVRRRITTLPILLLLAVAGWSAAPISAALVPTDDAAIEHALNRLTYGPRPGDVESVRRVGLAAWMEQQLHPREIDDGGIETRIASFKTLLLDSDDIAREYFEPAREARRERQRAQAGTPDPSMVNGGNPADMRGDRQILMELASAKLLRAVYSERQLEEVLVDFWFNHFNVFAGKGRTGMYVTEYERDAIRPHVLGRFRDLLEATAKSPAMLFYLDNWMSADSDSAHSHQRRPLQTPKRPRGLNENYGRELLELHTLGVEGGYTQADVVEVARALTGWTIDPRTHRFRFVPAMHDSGAKVVLGQRITAGGGMSDGERVLDILASHPSTATHIALKLSQRFVSDMPPPELVERAAARFRDTGGDLQEVVRTIIMSAEFFAPEYRRVKVKTPLEFVTSALRATAADVSDARPLLRALQQLGMPLYLCQPPTGYADTADTWVSSGALVTRMNVALNTASERARAVSIPAARYTDIVALRADLIRDALGGNVSATTRATIEKATTPEQTIALVLGSPEFQRR
jgi:uncharacterized protein (DUF1800 family)